MVWESHYWKQRLKALAIEIETISEENDASRLDISNLEISIFTGFFLTRKLIEAQTKLSTKVEEQSVNCLISNKTAESGPVDLFNTFYIAELYSLDSFHSKSRSLKHICNIFIHSHFLWMKFDEDEQIEAVYITSDYEKNKYIYLISLQDILEIFYSVIKDKNNILCTYTDPKTGETKMQKT